MKILNTIILGLACSIFTDPALAKRMAPTEIQAITTKRGIIQQSFERNVNGFSVYIIMKDKAGDQRWKTKIYSRKYEKTLETDVQDIHLKQLSLEDTSVIAIDEMGKRYEVDMGTGNLVKPSKPTDYSPNAQTNPLNVDTSVTDIKPAPKVVKEPDFTTKKQEYKPPFLKYNPLKPFADPQSQFEREQRENEEQSARHTTPGY